MERYYFDHNATTPVSGAVLEEFVATVRDIHGNASSIHHDGQLAKQRLEMSRRRLAEALGCEAREVVFTSGGTEANNLAILGAMRNAEAGRGHLITTRIEHPSVLRACGQLEREGASVTYLPVGSDGVVDPLDVRRALRPETALISVMHVNSETGAIQPVEQIGYVAREAGVALHVDGVQAFGKIAVKLEELGADLYSMSGHKVYAPKGIGALYVRKGTRLGPILHGGRHEHGLRAGTENVAGAVALGRAAEEMRETLEESTERIRTLRDLLEQGILARVPSAWVNAGRAARVPNTANIGLEGIEGEAMVISLDLKGFSVSSGSACSSGAVEPSHVLMAMGLGAAQARSCLRFSLGRGNTLAQVDALLDAVAESAAHLRRLSPTYSEQ